jgi:Protein of unknown function (DUF3179)
MKPSMPMKPGRTFLLWLLPCLLFSFFLLIYPLYVIRPFRFQGAGELAAALSVLRYRPIGMAACVLAVFAAIVWYWRHERRWLRRLVSAVGLVAVSAAAVLSRVNVYELMFHPIERASFSDATTSKLDGDENVIAVRLNVVARAYPIRAMSYHHLLNDTLDGVPIVPTY